MEERREGPQFRGTPAFGDGKEKADLQRLRRYYPRGGRMMVVVNKILAD